MVLGFDSLSTSTMEVGNVTVIVAFVVMKQTVTRVALPRMPSLRMMIATGVRMKHVQEEEEENWVAGGWMPMDQAMLMGLVGLEGLTTMRTMVTWLLLLSGSGSGSGSGAEYLVLHEQDLAKAKATMTMDLLVGEKAVSNQERTDSPKRRERSMIAAIGECRVLVWLLL